MKKIYWNLVPFKFGLKLRINVFGKYEYYLGETIRITGVCFHKNIVKHQQISSIQIGLNNKFEECQLTLENSSSLFNCPQSSNSFFKMDLLADIPGAHNLIVNVELKNGKIVRLNRSKNDLIKIYIKDYRFDIKIPSKHIFNIKQHIRIRGSFHHINQIPQKIYLYYEEGKKECLLKGSRISNKIIDGICTDFQVNVVFYRSGKKSIEFEAILNDATSIFWNAHLLFDVNGLTFQLDKPTTLLFETGECVTFIGRCFHDKEKIVKIIFHFGNLSCECPYESDPMMKFKKKNTFNLSVYFYHKGSRKVWMDVFLESGIKETRDIGIISISEKRFHPILKDRNGYRLNPGEQKEALSTVNIGIPIDRGKVAFTIVDMRMLNHALALKNSFLKHNPDYRFFIILLDWISDKAELEFVRQILEKEEDILFWSGLKNEIRIEHIEPLFFKYHKSERFIILRPFAFEYFMNAGFHQVLFIQPITLCFDGIHVLEEVLAEADIILPDNPYIEKRKNGIDIYEKINVEKCRLNFVAMKATQKSIALIHQWEDEVFEIGFNGKPETIIFNDLVKLEFFPYISDDAFWIENKPFNIGKCEIMSNEIVTSKNERYFKEKKLVFMNLCYVPWENLEKTILEYQKTENFAYDDIKNNEQHPYHILNSFQNYFDYLPATDIKMPDVVRKCFFEEILESVIMPYRPDEVSVNTLLSILFQNDYFDEGINFVTHLIWKSRKDLKEAFPDLSKKDSLEKYRQWIHDRSGIEYDLDERFKNGNAIWSEIPHTHHYIGINVISYFSQLLGISESARSFINNIYLSGIPFSLYNVETTIHEKIPRNDFLAYTPYLSEKPVYDVSLFFVNPPELFELVKDRHPYLFQNKYRIGIFWWEFDDHFYSQKEKYQNLDACIVFNEFVQKAIEKAMPPDIPITKLNYPFIKNWKISFSKEEIRGKLGIGSEEFVFFFNFDFYSTIERKNPEGILKAFSKSFKNEKHVRLLIKISHSDKHKKKYHAFIDEIEKNGIQDQVFLVDALLTKNEFMSYLNSTDCYVSLHRSEGMGLGMLEAMALGKPVIATRYGGNLDFMTEDNSMLVDFQLKSLKEDALPYKKGWFWADPELDDASAYMSSLVHNRQIGEHIGKKAKKSIQNRYQPRRFATEFIDFIRKF